MRDGGDVTIVALGRMVQMAPSRRRTRWTGEGISCEIVDPRTTSPLDEDTILESVENTGRLVVVDEAGPRCGMAADIVARVAQEAFGDLKAPPRMVTPPHTPVPFSPVLEDAYVPGAGRRSPRPSARRRVRPSARGAAHEHGCDRRSWACRSGACR